jgi:hypothetical protein
MRSKIRLALYDPDPDRPEPTSFVGPSFRDTPERREWLRDIIAKFNRLSSRRRKIIYYLGITKVSPSGRKAVSK